MNNPEIDVQTVRFIFEIGGFVITILTILASHYRSHLQAKEMHHQQELHLQARLSKSEYYLKQCCNILGVKTEDF